MESEILKEVQLVSQGILFIDETGRRLSLSGVNLEPLTYHDLRAAKLHDKLDVNLTWRGARVVDGNDFEIETGLAAGGSTVLQSRFTSQAIGLVRGGWLPSGLAVKTNIVVFPDRNIISAIQTRFENGTKRNGKSDDFLDLFAGQAVRINPLLYALEGNQKRLPTRAQMSAQLDEAISKIKTALPEAILVGADEKGLEGAVGLIEDSRASMEQKADFLVKVAPALSSPVSRKAIQTRWQYVLSEAASSGVTRTSLVVLAALSAVVVPNGGSPAKRMLKFKRGYSNEDAYNALVDLRSLEIMTYLLALHPATPMMLCTADKDMALVWSGLRATNFVRSGSGIRFDLSPVEDFLPGVSPAQWSAFIG